MNFQKLKQVPKTFGIELSSEEKHKIIGKSQKHKPLLYVGKMVVIF
jgi:hypothetical protein